MVEYTLPDISERAATGDIAALYRRIRRESGSPLVNYVWRHLATIPGAAMWCWELSRAQDAAGRVGQIIAVRGSYLATLKSADAGRTVNLGADGLRILNEYNRNNVLNLACTGILLSALGRKRSVTAQVPEPAEPDLLSLDARGPLISLPDAAGMSDADRVAAQIMSQAGPAKRTGVSPSLWRHLSVQPGFLPTIAPTMATVLASSGFAQAHDLILQAACSTEVNNMPELPAAIDRARLLDSIDAFSARIAELTLAGAVLGQWSRSATGAQ